MIDQLVGKAKLSLDEGAELPDIIPNSTLQLDGDISCYYSAWVDMPLGACINQLKRHIETKRLLAGYESVNVHTTHGSKANRENFALLAEYQNDRKKNVNPEQKARVNELRRFLQTYNSDTVVALPSFEVEADDAMNIMQRIEIEAGRVSGICTKDKDLDMCPGIHFEYDSMEQFIVPDGYGKLFVIETEKVDPKRKSGIRIEKKVKGHGTAFFWLQVLMGDTADSVPGLPRITSELLNKYQPIKATLKANADILKCSPMSSKYKAAQKVLAKRKSSTIGQITAYNMLKNCTSNAQAMHVVLGAYTAFYGKKPFEFEAWHGEKYTGMTSGLMMLEQSRLLWMLRTWDDDVLKFFKEVTLDVQP